MGLGLFGSYRDDDNGVSGTLPDYAAITAEVKAKMKREFPNPDPSNWQHRRSIEIGKYLIVELRYPDCTNFEGNKIMMYQNVGLRDLLAQERIDPHFAENAKTSPIARFPPTKEGWNLAMKLANTLTEQGEVQVDFRKAK